MEETKQGIEGVGEESTIEPAEVEATDPLEESLVDVETVSKEDVLSGEIVEALADDIVKEELAIDADQAAQETAEMLPEAEVTEAAESYLDRIKSKIAGDPKTGEATEPEEAEAVEEEDEPVAEAPKRTINPRNTRA